MLPSLLLLAFAASTPQDPSPAAAAGAAATGPQPSIRALLTAHADRFGAVLDAPDAHVLQIALAEVVTTDDGHATLRRSTFGDLSRYFYPASTVKLCAAVATLLDLQRVNAEHGTDFGLTSHLSIGTLFDGDEPRSGDPADLDGGLIAIGHQIRQICLVSDNRAYNNLYEWLGHRRLNESMHAAGLTRTRIFHRLSEFHSRDDQLRTRPVQIRSGTSDATRTRAARTSDLRHDNADLPGIDVGTAHFAGGRRIDRPFSFRFKNSMPLLELQDLLIAVVRPDLDTGRRGFPELSLGSRRFLMQALSELPRESRNPRYDPAKYPDEYCKFVLPGVRRVVPAEHVRVYDKIGRAYGFSTENAYVEDQRTGRAFFLAAVIYTNADGTLNDNVYEYDTVADPFFATLGEVVAAALLGNDAAAADRTRRDR